jgi:ketosteroid isomerase-like protein
VGGAPRGAAARTAPAAKPAATAPVVAETKPAAAETKPVAAATKPAVAEAKPAPSEKPVAANAATANDEEQLKVVNAWAAAWSKKDVGAYLSYYAKDFKTPNGQARAEWEKGRRVRIQAPKSISVMIEKPKVSMTGDTHASVAFRQHYKSDTLSVNSNKTLVLVKTAAGWRIQQERSSN